MSKWTKQLTFFFLVIIYLGSAFSETPLQVGPETSSLSIQNGSTIEATYKGIARNKNGDIVYEETHIVTSLGGRVQQSKTTYQANGKTIAEMQSDFRQHLNRPDYHFKDLRTGEEHGVQSEGSNVKVWRQLKGKNREEKTFPLSKFPKDDLIVSCQGLHYYLNNHFSEIENKKSVNVHYLMPGALDYYTFKLNLAKQDAEQIQLKLHLKNLLRIFAPELHLTYKKPEMKLVHYEGLSNLTNEKGKLQMVQIEYR